MEKNKKKDSMIMDALKLFMITLAAGCLLGLVYQITKQPIEDAKEKAKIKAYQEVFPSAASFAPDEELSKKITEDTKGVFLSEILTARDAKGNDLGYVMSFGSKEGYGGMISLSMGIDLTGAITGLEVLSMSETAGLGAKCTADEFKSQFAGIASQEIVFTKSGKSADNEIDAISGATITTKAVTGAVNYALQFVYENGKIEAGQSAAN